MALFKRFSGGPIDFLAVGLGNPGKRYENTRHNAGWMALSALAAEQGAEITRSRFKGLCGEATIAGKRVLLLFPQTLMNNSGESVGEAMRFYKLTPDRLVVFSDDVSLPLGTVRVRRKGSDGGQKGLRSITAHIDSEDFARIKLGIGEKPHPEMSLADWVLSRFTATELKTMADAADRAAHAGELVIEGKVDEAMNRYSK